MAVIGSLSVKLGLVTQDFQRQMNDAKTQVGGLKSSFDSLNRALGMFGVSLGATAIVGYGKQVMDFADEVQDLGAAFDLSVSKVLQFRDALGQSGGKAENAEKILGTLFDKIQAARDGMATDQVAQQFQKLGLSISDLKQLQPEQALEAVFRGLSKINSTYERTALIKDLLGKGGLGLDISNLAKLMSESSAGFDKNATAIANLAEQADRLERAQEKIKQFFTGPLSAMIEFTAHAITVGQVMAKLVTSSGMQEYTALIKQGYSEKDAMDIMAGNKQLPANAPTTPGGYFGVKAGGTMGGIAPVDMTAFGKGTQKVRQFPLGVAAKDIPSILDEVVATAEIRDIAQQKALIVLYDQIDALQKQIDYADDLAEIERQAALQDAQNQASFKFGWDQAFAQYAEEAKNASHFGAEMFNTFTSDITYGVLEFARTGKLAFKDFAASVIQDLLRIAIRMQMMNLISGKFNSSVAGSSVSINTAGMSGDIDLSNMNLPTHASGGFTSGASIVGENGPELFIPNRPGTIIPNARMGDFMGGQPSVIYNGPYIASMNAIDTQSATQFLARNKNAVFAANQSAMRGMPAGR